MLGSLQEAQDVLANRGVALDIKTIRLIAYRYAARARLVQQVERTTFEDTVAHRRVVISSDGGRLRLRETKRGPKTKKGGRRYTGAWREPKVLLVYVVDAEGKCDARFVPVMDATLKGPDAVFALLRTYFLTVAPKMHSSLASRINSASEGIRRPLEPLVAHLCSVAPHQFGSTSGAHDVFLCFQGLSGVDAVYRRDSWLLLRA